MLKRSLGQNFLINQGILDKIVTATELSKNEMVVEIGPGTGNLTIKLSEKAGRVIAIEKDYRLIEGLKEKFKNTNVEIIEGDVLKIDIGTLVNAPLSKASENWGLYKVVGNIPYYVTSNLLRMVFEKWPQPKLIVLTVQKEVAQRIVAKPPYMNLLALSVQLYSDAKIVGPISKGSFRPIPKVDSAIIGLIPKEIGQVKAEEVMKVARAGFSQKRKRLISNLASAGYEKWALEEIFDKLKINRQTRAQELSPNQWIDLCQKLKSS